MMAYLLQQNDVTRPVAMSLSEAKRRPQIFCCSNWT